ncbi:MAG: helix-turn-helix transcriptional regulator [Lachnospiraceae bacterium]|nr:helix-turn-helix transcriptional regulator [Lachnospiraceae bacterium]
MKTLIGNIKKATIEMLILQILSETDMYGYQITQEFKKRSNEEFIILEGSMYPILYRLADSGCISSYNRKAGIRKTRVYYHIEETGIKRLEEMKEEFRHAVGLVELLMQSRSSGNTDSEPHTI